MIHPRYLSRWGPDQLTVLNAILREIIDHVNRWVFGIGRKHEFEITDTGPSGTDFTVNHNLGHRPFGWILYFQDKPGSLYLVDWDNKTATFRFSADNAHIKFRLF